MYTRLHEKIFSTRNLFIVLNHNTIIIAYSYSFIKIIEYILREIQHINNPRR